MKFIIMIIAFLIKEVHDVRRQPRLLLSLVGGPLLVLGLFGATFRSANPFVTAALVWPQEGIPGVTKEEAAAAIGNNLSLSMITSDEKEAMRLLEDGSVDVVQVVPKMPAALGKNAVKVRLVSKTVDPNAEAWVRSVGFVEVGYINQQILTQAMRDAQTNAQKVVVDLAEARSTLSQLNRTLDPKEIEASAAYVDTVHDMVGRLADALPEVAIEQPLLAPKVKPIQVQVEVLQSHLEKLQEALTSGDVAGKLAHLKSVLAELEDLRVTVNIFVETPAETIVSPVQESYTNLRGGAYSLVVFYAPAVLALLVQQLAVTLAGLGLVRERQMGSFEMFRVSPLRFVQILAGKSLAYVMFSTIAGIVLAGLMALLKVPLPADPLQFLGILVLLATASVGLGTLISSVSRTDSQAIQLTMLVLLLSVFFTGFFMPIRGFMWPAWIIALLLPMTYAIMGFKDLLLASTSPSLLVPIGLTMITLLSFGAVMLIMRRQYRRVLD